MESRRAPGNSSALRPGRAQEGDPPSCPDDRQWIVSQNDAMAGRGLRVLALAYRDDPELQEQGSYPIDATENRLIFLGLAAMSDPIRPQVPGAIRACHTAGIRVTPGTESRRSWPTRSTHFWSKKSLSWILKEIT